MAAKKSTWIAGTAFAAAVVIASSWFVAINPTMTQAADLRDQTQQVKSQNEILRQKNQKLAADYKNLPQYKDDLAKLQTKVPPTAQLSDYIRQLDQIATVHSVVITSVAPSPAQAFAAATPSKPKANPTPTATSDGTSGPASTPSPSPSSDSATSTGSSGTTGRSAGSGGPAGFADIPVAITVVGTYDNALAFMNDLQTSTPRVFLVASFTSTAQKKADASAGRPATNDGDQELAITGFLYVLPDGAATVPSPSASATAPTLPTAVPGKNPLVPVAGK